jgi:hypothetical protein
MREILMAWDLVSALALLITLLAFLWIVLYRLLR